MKSKLAIITIGLVLGTLTTMAILPFASSDALTNRTLNANSWAIKIGDKIILSNSKNEMGAQTEINKKSIKPADMLHAQLYLCGQSGDRTTTTLTIKNNFNTTVKEITHKNASIMFEADLPMNDILNEFVPGQTMNIYFTISGAEKDLNKTVLLGKIKLK